MRRIKRERFEQFLAPYRAAAEDDSDELDSSIAHLCVTNQHFARLYRILKIKHERKGRHSKFCLTGSDAAWAHRDYAKKVGHKWRARK